MISQACGASGCRLCKLLYNLNETICINGMNLQLDNNLNCKTKYCIYVATCKICNLSYFGQTVTEAHIRFNGHRRDFTDISLYDKSALSQHCSEDHPDSISLDNFKIGIVKVCIPECLDREEDKFITKFRTNIWGLNRMRVVK